MDDLLTKVKQNLILDHSADDDLLSSFITAAGGFFADNVQAGQQVWNTVNLLLRLDRDWKV